MRKVLLLIVLATVANSGQAQWKAGPARPPSSPTPTSAIRGQGAAQLPPSNTQLVQVVPNAPPATGGPTADRLPLAMTPTAPTSATPASAVPFPECLFCAEPAAAALAPAGCGPAGQFWLRGEYLLWWTRGSQSPPLITTGVPGMSPLPGTLGQTGTSVIYGGPDDDSRPRSGGRFTAGFWLDPCRRIGLEAGYFFLGDRTSRFDAASDARLGSQLIARPFFDVLTNSQNAQLVAFPALSNGTNILTATGMGLASGDIHASSYSRLQGAEINALCCACSGCNYWVQFLAGFRYLNLEEGISINENTRVNPALPAVSPFFGGSTISISDRFDTRNNFYGGQVGLRGEVRRGRMFVEVQSRVALGVTNQVVDIRGSTAITSPDGTTAVTPVGFLASGSNSGRYTRDEFSVVPEVGVNAGVAITPNLRAFVGYNFLYWSSVVRPGDQIDTNLSGTQIPTDTRYDPSAGPFRPVATIRDTGFWVQGVSFGLDFRY